LRVGKVIAKKAVCSFLAHPVFLCYAWKQNHVSTEILIKNRWQNAVLNGWQIHPVLSNSNATQNTNSVFMQLFKKYIVNENKLHQAL